MRPPFAADDQYARFDAVTAEGLGHDYGFGQTGIAIVADDLVGRDRRDGRLATRAAGQSEDAHGQQPAP